MNKYEFLRFNLFTAAPQESLTLKPNWTGQQNGQYDYTAAEDLTPEMKTFYDKALIRMAEPMLVHDQFGQKRPIPAGNGKTIEFRKFASLPKISEALTEGITPDGQKYSVSAITATVAQYGAYIATTDMLNLTAFDNTMAEITKMLASQAARTSDTLTRDVLCAGTNVMWSDADNGGNDARTKLQAEDVLTVGDIKKARRLLQRNNAPTISGCYVAIIHPDTEYDLMQDSEWQEASKYAGSTQIFNGEIGKLYNVRFVVSTEAKIWKDSTCPVISGSDYRPVYATLVLGENAFGVTSINNGGIQTIVKQLGSGGTADPLDQRSTVGWKLNKVAKILVPEYLVRIEHVTSFGASASAN